MIWLVLFRCVGAFIATADNRHAEDASIRSRRGAHPSFIRRNHAIKPSSSSLFATVTNTRGGDSNDNNYTSTESSSSNQQFDSLVEKAQRHLREKDADQAFATLAQAYGIDPTSTTIAALFESCLGLKIELAEELYSTWKNDAGRALSEAELTNLFQDRMGLSSLFIDKEEYDEAGIQLRKAIEEAQYWLS